MARSGPEVADIFRRYGAAYRDTHGASLCTAQRRVMSAIELCRTAALGGHVEHCDRRDHQRICYNSCRDRHCPKCQALARAQWLEDRRSELLDTQYFHVVFTVPQPIATIALQNKEIVYNILFRAAGETLRTIAADPKHLGAQLGFFAVLHTWGQALFHHPHLHCVVPGGGISRTARDGFPAGRISSCPFQRWRVCFVDCSFIISGRPSTPATCSSFRPWNHFGCAMPSCVTSLPPGKRIGLSMPSNPSPDRKKCSSMSHGIHTASLSPTIVCSISMTARFSFAGRIIATAIAKRP